MQIVISLFLMAIQLSIYITVAIVRGLWWVFKKVYKLLSKVGLHWFFAYLTAVLLVWGYVLSFTGREGPAYEIANGVGTAIMYALLIGGPAYKIVTRRVGGGGKRPLFRPKPHGFVFGLSGLKWATRPETGQEHILVLGAPGTGKSQALAIPSLKCWSGGVFAIDIKGELSALTAADGDGVLSVPDTSKAGYDPFYLAQLGSLTDTDVAIQVAQMLIPRPEGEKDPFWTDSARNMLTAVLLAALNRGQTFVQAMDVAASGSAGVLAAISGATGPVAVYGSSFLSMDEKTLANVYSTVHANVAVFAADYRLRGFFDRQTTADARDVAAGRKVFLAIDEAHLEQYAPVVRLIVAQTMRYFEVAGRADNPCLMLVDEFPRLGRIDTVANALATLRSRGVCVCLIAQSLSQLQQIYSKEQAAAIVDMASYIAVLSAKGDTAAMLTKLVGDRIEQMGNSGSNSQMLNPVGFGKSKGMSEQYQPTIRENEWGNLGGELILIDGSPASKKAYRRVSKVPYFRNKRLYDRR